MVATQCCLLNSRRGRYREEPRDWNHPSNRTASTMQPDRLTNKGLRTVLSGRFSSSSRCAMNYRAYHAYATDTSGTRRMIRKIFSSMDLQQSVRYYDNLLQSFDTKEAPPVTAGLLRFLSDCWSSRAKRLRSDQGLPICTCRLRPDSRAFPHPR